VKKLIKFIKQLKYLIILYISKKNKNYDTVLKMYKKIISLDLAPTYKKVNYNLSIFNIAKEIFKKKNIKMNDIKIEFSQPKVLILNSEIYDTGGHTELALRYIEAFKDEYLIDFYLTTIGKSSNESAPVKSKFIKKIVNNYYESPQNLGFDEKVIELYHYIINQNITTIYVNMHMFDTVACAVLGVLKKYTNINIIFWNHGDHWYSLGTDFADIILTRIQNCQAITPYLKDKKNIVQPPFLESSNEINKYSEIDINKIKEVLNIPVGAFITMTGCGLGKLNDEYFALIKNILDKNENVYHLFICTMKDKKKREIKDKIGKNKERLIIINFVPNFDFYIQLSDLYVDSFPQGSALTLVDCIKHAKPVVIKVNKTEPIKSFEEYLYKDYEFACETSKLMEEKIYELINDKEKYKQISNKVRAFYCERYNIKKVKEIYRELFK